MRKEKGTNCIFSITAQTHASAHMIVLYINGNGFCSNDISLFSSSATSLLINKGDTEYYYLTSSRPEGRLRPFRTALHPSRSLAAAAAPAHDFQPISSRCLSTLLLHVTRGLPRLLLPSGAQFSAVLAMLLPSLRRTCPIHLHLRIFIVTDNGCVLVVILNTCPKNIACKLQYST